MNDSQSNSRPERKPLFHFWRCFWLSFLVLSLAYAWYCFYVPTNDIAWADNYTSAQQQAADSEKPIVLYFTGTWCVPCRIMKREVWSDEQVALAVNSQFIPVAIDVSDPENAALMARYKVEGAPVLIVTDPDGSAIDWHAGKMGKPEFLKFLRSTQSATENS